MSEKDMDSALKANYNEYTLIELEVSIMPQTKRQEQKDLTRPRIVNTAFRLYSENGFFIPTNTIAQQASLSHSAIFVHFPTREALQLYVLEQFAHEIGHKLHNLSTEGASISELLHAHIRILKEYEFFYTKLILEIKSLPDEARITLISLQSAMSLHFSIAIEQSQQAGTVKEIPLHVLFNAWLGLLHYYLQNGDLFASGESVLERCGDELVNNFIELISK